MHFEAADNEIPEWLAEIHEADFVASLDTPDDIKSEWLLLVGRVVRAGTPERAIHPLFSGYGDTIYAAVRECREKMEAWDGPDTSREG